jgi:hypothetical protein
MLAASGFYDHRMTRHTAHKVLWSAIVGSVCLIFLFAPAVASATTFLQPISTVVK